jgi:hypothetical protein
MIGKGTGSVSIPAQDGMQACARHLVDGLGKALGDAAGPYNRPCKVSHFSYLTEPNRGRQKEQQQHP